jgi:hypothetical protein
MITPNLFGILMVYHGVILRDKKKTSRTYQITCGMAFIRKQGELQ